MMFGFLTSLGLTLLLGPYFIRKLYQLKIGQKIRSKEECPLLYQLHEKKKETPTMGGMLILSAMLISMFVWMDFSSAFTWILLITTVVLGVLGAMDDYLKLKKKTTTGLRPNKKMFVQTLLSAFLAFYLLTPAVESSVITKPHAKIINVKKGVTHEYTMDQYMGRFYIPFVKKSVFTFKGWNKIFLFVLFLFVIIGSSNAVNLTDGLDGLATGCMIFVCLLFALVAFLSSHIGMASYLNILYIEQSQQIAIYLCSMAGALLGFLWYNGYPAQVFMGDTGSLALGGIIGVVSVLLRREFLLAIVGGIFVVEALSVIIQVLSYRYRNQKRVFLCAPLHHHFEYKGWPETKVVVRFWIIGFLLAMIGILSLKLQ